MTRFLAIAAWALLACSSGPVQVSPPPPPPPPPPTGAVRLLFIGNSLTYAYNIPGLVKQMSTAAGLIEPYTVSATYPDYALEDHWVSGTARSDITQRFDRVIMQQGPSTLPESGVALTQWTSTWSDEARKYGARPGLYVVWPPRGGDLAAGIANHEAAAAAANAALYPVAHAWREAWSVDPAMPLYGPDQFHPSQHGSWLAALIITAMVHDRPVGDFPNLFPAQITATQERVLRAAATKAIALYGRR
ncbi:MAG: hypothetical protein V4558_05155 [Gemmatimonadota bacterium]